MSLPQCDSQGRVYFSINAPTGTSTLNGGIAYQANGSMCTTPTPGADDVWNGGIRCSPTGQVVVGDGIPPARPYVYNGGLPFDKRDGSLIRQVDVVPAASDPYVGEIRVGPLGGVYFTTAAPP